VLERNIFKQFNEPSPGDRVVLRWILEPGTEYVVAALVRIMIGLCPPHLQPLFRNVKNFPNGVPFVTNDIDYSQAMCFTSFFPLDQRKVSTNNAI